MDKYVCVMWRDIPDTNALFSLSRTQTNKTKAPNVVPQRTQAYAPTAWASGQRRSMVRSRVMIEKAAMPA